MFQKHVQIFDKKISYLDQGNSDHGVILFIHGNSFSSQTFSPQFNSKELTKYRIIAVDLYGHGESDRLDNSLDYSLPTYAKLINEFIKELKLEKVILAGHSLGGHIALELIGSLKNKNISGVFVWGTPPVTNPIVAANIFHPNPSAGYLYQEKISDTELDEFLNNCFGMNKADFKSEVNKTDGACRTSLGASIGALNFHDEIEAIKNSAFDIAVLYAIEDKFMNPAYFESLQIQNLWNSKTTPISGSHFCHHDNSEQFNSFLNSYIESRLTRFYSDHAKNIIEQNIAGTI